MVGLYATDYVASLLFGFFCRKLLDCHARLEFEVRGRHAIVQDLSDDSAIVREQKPLPETFACAWCGYRI